MFFSTCFGLMLSLCDWHQSFVIAHNEEQYRTKEKKTRAFWMSVSKMFFQQVILSLYLSLIWYWYCFEISLNIDIIIYIKYRSHKSNSILLALNIDNLLHKSYSSMIFHFSKLIAAIIINNQVEWYKTYATDSEFEIFPHMSFY